MTERAAGRKNTTQFVFAENSLDILRLFAALQIAITHYLNLTMLTYGKDGPGDGLLLGFKRALTLFPGLIILFSISGFLMGETLMRTQNRKIFAQKRILRLYPALWVNIVLTIGMLSLLPGVVSGHGKDLLTWAVVQGVGLAAVLFAGVCDRKHQRDALGADGGNSTVRSGCGGLETVSGLERPYLACPLGADCAVKSRLRPFKEFGSASRRGSFPAGSKFPAVSGLVFCRAISVAF